MPNFFEGFPLFERNETSLETTMFLFALVTLWLTAEVWLALEV